MIDKKHRGNKYIHCFCKQDKDVLVGAKFLGILQPILAVAGIAFACWALFLSIDLWAKVTMIVFLGLPWLIGFPSDYYTAKKWMLEAGHSLECSRKIGRYYAIYSNLWTEFKIMEKENNGRISTVEKSGKRK